MSWFQYRGGIAFHAAGHRNRGAPEQEQYGQSEQRGLQWYHGGADAPGDSQEVRGKPDVEAIKAGREVSAQAVGATRRCGFLVGCVYLCQGRVYSLLTAGAWRARRVRELERAV